MQRTGAMKKEDRDFNLIIIGGGPGGYTAAIRAAQEGLDVALVEETARLGGICLNWGCIPTKSLLKSAEIYHMIQQAGEFGITTGETATDFGLVMTRSLQLPEQIAIGINRLMKKNRITVLKGRATLTGNGGVAIAGDKTVTLTAQNIILAVGAHPALIPGIEPDSRRVLTSNDIFRLDTQPTSILIIGGGAIGVQFASFFRTFGTDVTLVDVADRILPGIDIELSKRLAFLFRKRGIAVKTGVRVESLNIKNDRCRAVLSDGTQSESEIVLTAAGYTGNVEGIGAAAAAVACERGFIVIDSQYRTSAPGIYAIGDCIGQPMLAYAAAMEGERAVAAITGKKTARLDPRLVPIAIYSQPNVASIGYSEEDARAAGHEILTGVCPFRAIGKAVALGETAGYTKVIIDRSSQMFLGTHILGHSADEILQEVVLAMHAGISATQLLETTHPHPTLTESIREATAAALGRPVNL